MPSPGLRDLPLVKSFYEETPDCGFSAIPRWLARRKMQAMVNGTLIVRAELTG